MTPSALDISLGDLTTVPEETAYAAYQTLQAARTDTTLAANPLLAQSRDALRSYVSERTANGHSLFPSVTETANRKRNDLLTGLYTKPLSEALPAENYAEIERRAGFTADPDEFKQRTINRAFLSATLGKEIPAEQYDSIRQIYARQHLGLKEDTSEKTVYSAIQSRFKEEQASTETLRSLSQSAFAGTFKPGATIPSTLTKEQLQAFPERLRENAAAQYSQNVREARRTKRRLTPIVDKIHSGILKNVQEQGDKLLGIDYVGLDFTELLHHLPENKNDRQLALGLLANRLKESSTDRNLANRLALSIERGVENFAS